MEALREAFLRAENAEARARAAEEAREAALCKLSVLQSELDKLKDNLKQ